MVTLQSLFDDLQDRIGLQWLAGHGGALLTLPSVCQGGPDVAGFLNIIHPQRIQILGHAELEYLNRTDRDRSARLFEELIQARVPAFVMADGLQPPDWLVTRAEQAQIPVWQTAIAAPALIDILRIYLSKRLAPMVTLHGVFLDVLGMGVLITGESGLGKSELALELISRGHGLVADDAVELARIAPEIIEGRCPELLQNLLEVRGLGLLDIRAIFGETSIRRKMKLKLVVHLVRSATLDSRFERLPLQEQTQEVLGLQIRKVVLPVAAGRNLAVLVEAAVRSAILHLRGIDTLRDFLERQRLAMQGPPP